MQNLYLDTCQLKNWQGATTTIDDAIMILKGEIVLNHSRRPGQRGTSTERRPSRCGRRYISIQYLSSV